MLHRKFRRIMLVITLIVLAFGLSTCTSDTANDNSDEEDHGVTIMPIIHSDGSSGLMFLPY